MYSLFLNEINKTLNAKERDLIIAITYRNSHHGIKKEWNCL